MIVQGLPIHLSCLRIHMNSSVTLNKTQKAGGGIIFPPPAFTAFRFVQRLVMLRNLFPVPDRRNLNRQSIRKPPDIIYRNRAPHILRIRCKRIHFPYRTMDYVLIMDFRVTREAVVQHRNRTLIRMMQTGQVSRHV